jgi:hypothetical protein
MTRRQQRALLFGISVPDRASHAKPTPSSKGPTTDGTIQAAELVLRQWRSLVKKYGNRQSFYIVLRGGIGQESKDFTFLTRIQVGLYSVLGALRATHDWRAIQDELMFGEPPQTDLGRRHKAWRTTRETR